MHYFGILLFIIGSILSYLNYLIYSKVTKTCSNDSTIKNSNIANFTISLLMTITGLGLIIYHLSGTYSQNQNPKFSF